MHTSAYLEERARSSQFDTANPAARAIPTVDEILGTTGVPERAFRLLASVINAAGAWAHGMPVI